MDSWLGTALARQLGLSKEEAEPMATMVLSLPTVNEQLAYLQEVAGFDQAWLQSFRQRQSPPSQKQQQSQVLHIVSTNHHKPSSKKNSQQPKRDRPSKPSTSQTSTSTRQLCPCLATIHPLFTNCLTCGKILCEAEGPGPCTFCATPVQSRDQQLKLWKTRRKANIKTVIPRVTYRSKTSHHGSMSTLNDSTTNEGNSGSGVGVDEGQFPKLAMEVAGKDESLALAESDVDLSQLDKAVLHKNKLLEFDRTDAIRSRIHDQAEDFQAVQTDIWLTPEQRAVAMRAYQAYHDQMEDAKRKLRVTLDLAGQTVTVDTPEQIAKPDLHALYESKAKPPIAMNADEKVEFQSDPPPRYVPSGKSKVQKAGKDRFVKGGRSGRRRVVQDDFNESL